MDKSKLTLHNRLELVSRAFGTKMTNRRKNVTPKQKQEVLRLSEAGLSAREVVQTVTLSLSTVYNIKRKAKVALLERHVEDVLEVARDVRNAIQVWWIDSPPTRQISRLRGKAGWWPVSDEFCEAASYIPFEPLVIFRSFDEHFVHLRPLVKEWLSIADSCRSSSGPMGSDVLKRWHELTYRLAEELTRFILRHELPHDTACSICSAANSVAQVQGG